MKNDEKRVATIFGIAATNDKMGSRWCAGHGRGSGGRRRAWRGGASGAGSRCSSGCGEQFGVGVGGLLRDNPVAEDAQGGSAPHVVGDVAGRQPHQPLDEPG